MGENKGIFQRLKSVLLGSEIGNSDVNNAIYSKAPEVDVRFAENFTAAGGYFVFCESNIELAENLKLLMKEKEWQYLFSDDLILNRILRHTQIPHKNLLGLSECQARITPCEGLIANFGHILMSPKTDKGRQLAACPKAHIVVAYTSQLAFSKEEAMEKSYEKSQLSKNPLAFTVLGGQLSNSVHEKEINALSACTPSELYLFLVED